jgi:hypothetical protein
MWLRAAALVFARAVVVRALWHLESVCVRHEAARMAAIRTDLGEFEFCPRKIDFAVRGQNAWSTSDRQRHQHRGRDLTDRSKTKNPRCRENATGS